MIDKSPSPQSAWYTLSTIFITHFAIQLFNAVNAIDQPLDGISLGIAISIWIVIPVIALFLIWKRNQSGRWILGLLFGLRTIICLLLLVFFYSRPFASSTFMTSPALIYSGGLLFEIAFYSTSAGWLLNSSKLSIILTGDSSQ